MLEVSEAKHLGSANGRFRNAEILRLRAQNDTKSVVPIPESRDMELLERDSELE